jgi:hypothetical protein
LHPKYEFPSALDISAKEEKGSQWPLFNCIFFLSNFALSRQNLRSIILIFPCSKIMMTLCEIIVTAQLNIQVVAHIWWQLVIILTIGGSASNSPSIISCYHFHEKCKI